MNRTKRVVARPKKIAALRKVVRTSRRKPSTGAFKDYGVNVRLPGDEAVLQRHAAN